MIPGNMERTFLKCLIAAVLCGLLSWQESDAQDFTWPTDASRLMTSSFGEYRPGHFHAGIDVKTWGQEGYRVFASADGYILQTRVSPYGYGKVIYQKSVEGHTFVYAHLSGFAPFLERIVRSEQIRRNRYAVRKTFKPRMVTVRKGELIGYTGSSGSGVPHLHFEVRDSLGYPFNPLFLNYGLEDLTPPTLQAVAVTPLSYGSTVNGDFVPDIVPIRRIRRDRYILDRIIRVWGKVGISLSAYDQAEGAWNRFSVFRIRLYIDDVSVFSVNYDRFSYDETYQVDLDRDFRLKSWGEGFFHKLYRGAGNTLSFYDSDSPAAGILLTDEGYRDSETVAADVGFRSTDDIEFLTPGDHILRIEVSDYFGNVSELRGILRCAPPEAERPFNASGTTDSGNETSRQASASSLLMERQFFDDFIYYRIEDGEHAGSFPTLFVELNAWDRTFVPLFSQGRGGYSGVYPLERGTEGLLVSELRSSGKTPRNCVIRDSLQVFEVSPDQGGTIRSPDGRCQIVIPRRVAYRRFTGFCRMEHISTVWGTESLQYRFYPDDIPLRGRARVYIDARSIPGQKNKMGIYSINGEGETSFVGNGWKGGNLTAWTGSLGSYSVLQDTIPPSVRFIYPEEQSHISDVKPHIVVEFADSLSGLYGERNYTMILDGNRLIVEYVPSEDLGRCLVDESLASGPHDLEIIVRDRAGNVSRRLNRFFVDTR